MANPKVVQAGEMVMVPMRVNPACDGKSGEWYCATHQVAFPNNFAKDSHISSKRGCRLAWWCSEHGCVEAPQ